MKTNLIKIVFMIRRSLLLITAILIMSYVFADQPGWAYGKDTIKKLTVPYETDKLKYKKIAGIASIATEPPCFEIQEQLLGTEAVFKSTKCELKEGFISPWIHSDPYITTDFDSGGGIEWEFDGRKVILTMTDKYEHPSFGYFHFKLHNVKNKEVEFYIQNREEARNPMPVKNKIYYMYESHYNLETLDQWKMFDEDIEGTFIQKFTENTVYISNTFPFPLSKQVEMIDKHMHKDHVEKRIIGESPEGRPIHSLIVHDPDHSGEIKDVLITAGTHPGETCGVWKLKGMLDYVLDIIENPGLRFEENYRFHFIPHASPDGVYKGIHRKTLGEDGNTIVNINRDFIKAEAVETKHIMNYMDNNLTNVYWTIDLHGSVNENHVSPIIINFDTQEQKQKMLDMEKYTLTRGGLEYREGEGYIGWYPTKLFPDSPSVLLESWVYHQGTVSDIKKSGKKSLELILNVLELSK